VSKVNCPLGLKGFHGNIGVFEAILQMGLKNFISQLSQDDRRELFYFALSKGITASKLGISQSYLYLLKTGQRKISDTVVEKILKNISVYDFIEYLQGPSSSPVRTPPLRGGVSNYSVKRVYRVFKQTVNEELVNAEVERFRRFLVSKNKKPRTVRERCRYLRKFLLQGIPLTPTGLVGFFSQLRPGEAEHYAKAVRLYLRFRKMKSLLDYVPSVRVEADKTAEVIPKYENVRKVAEYIDSKPALYLYATLAESGLRPGQGYSLTRNELVLEHRIIRKPVSSSTKRFWFTFFYTDLQEELVKHVKTLSGPRVFPGKPRELRLEIYKAMDRALGYRFDLYRLRDFFISYLNYRGVNPLLVEVLVGHRPPPFRVTVHSYLAPWILEMRTQYDKAQLQILR